MKHQAIVFLCLLALSGCRIEVAVDESQGCIKLDESLHCESFALDFAPGDALRITAVPSTGYTFSHWRKDHRYLFGENPDVTLILDARDIDGILPEETFYLEPVFVPDCRTDVLMDVDDEYRWINCRGHLQRANYAFADVLDVPVIHSISVLFYVDTNRPELLEMSAEQFVTEQLALQNDALERSGAMLRYEIAGVIPVDLPSTGETRSVQVVQEMRDAVAPFNNIRTERDAHDADLVHSLINYEYDGGTCGYAYTGVINWDSRFTVGSTACFITEGDRYAYVLGHELGHSLGLAHDRPNRTNTPTFTFGYGWSSPDDPERLGTVMSYAQEIFYYATPERRVQDALSGEEFPVGDIETDTVKAMNLVRLDYARLRPETGQSPQAARYQPGEPEAPRDCPRGPLRERRLAPG